MDKSGRIIASSYRGCRWRPWLRHQRRYATASEPSSQTPLRAAPPIRFTNRADQFARPRTESKTTGSRPPYDPILRHLRVIPASPSYFTATPRYMDDMLHLMSLIRKYKLLPLASALEAPHVAWKTLVEYKTQVAESVGERAYSKLVQMLKRLNSIHPSLLPREVEQTLNRFKRLVQPIINRGRPIRIDSIGRTRAVGRRKTSHAVVFLVEGEGQCMVNGRSLTEYFGRLHDRESALWALKVTQRLDKYNIWAKVSGGGTTGQAEAITLGVAKAIIGHEPDLKPALRKCESPELLGLPKDLLY